VKQGRNPSDQAEDERGELVQEHPHMHDLRVKLGKHLPESQNGRGVRHLEKTQWPPIMTEAGVVRLVGEWQRLSSAGEDSGVVSPGPQPVAQIYGHPLGSAGKHTVVVGDQDSHRRASDTFLKRVAVDGWRSFGNVEEDRRTFDTAPPVLNRTMNARDRSVSRSVQARLVL
jgi:hypothetical protein